jgi:tetracycline repressor-like protein
MLVSRLQKTASRGPRRVIELAVDREGLPDARSDYRRAAQLMYEHGAANTSFEDVRKAAKASGSQMSHYFADGRGLIRAVMPASPALSWLTTLQTPLSGATSGAAGRPHGQLQ